MKIPTQLIIVLLLLFYSCSSNSEECENNNETIDISGILTVANFETIKAFIINNGDVETYSNRFNNNPHFSFSGIEAYLDPETGHLNSNCDPELTDFNVLVIIDQKNDPQYYSLQIVRAGDILDSTIHTSECMAEGKVYLLNYDNIDYEFMQDNITNYTKLINNEISDWNSIIECIEYNEETTYLPEENYDFENWPGKSGTIKTNVEFPESLIEQYKLQPRASSKVNHLSYDFPLREYDSVNLGRIELTTYPSIHKAQYGLIEYMNDLTSAIKPPRFINDCLFAGDVAFGYKDNATVCYIFSRNNVQVTIKSRIGDIYDIAYAIDEAIQSAPE